MKSAYLFLSGISTYYLLLEAIFYWEFSNAHNLVAVGLIMLLLFHLFTENKYLGIAIGVLFFVFNVYMIFALLAEYHQFPNGDPAGTGLLIVGFLAFFSSLLMSILLVYNSSNQSDKSPTRTA
ncbi:MAG: hypothetical protein KTR30_35920 [Saprospiraceae bacterium]|nr:hypothetical protein [Saprospiraceae bacterium]